MAGKLVTHAAQLFFVSLLVLSALTDRSWPLSLSVCQWTTLSYSLQLKYSITWLYICAQVNFVSDTKCKQYRQITVMVWVQFTAFTCSAEYTRLWSISAAGICLLLSSFFCLSSALVAELHKFYFVGVLRVAVGVLMQCRSIRAQDGGAQFNATARG